MELSTVHPGFAGPDLFSSGMWRAIMVSGSWQRTSQPSRSLTRPVSGLRKLLGMRLQMTGVNIWTSSRGGHWGTGFLRSLRNMAVDIGMMFWARQAKKILDNTRGKQKTKRNKMRKFHPLLLLFTAKAQTPRNQPIVRSQRADIWLIPRIVTTPPNSFAPLLLNMRTHNAMLPGWSGSGHNMGPLKCKCILMCYL